MSTRPGGINSLNTPQGREALQMLESSYRLPPATPPPLTPPISTPPPNGVMGGIIRTLLTFGAGMVFGPRPLGDLSTPPNMDNPPIRDVMLPPGNRRRLNDYPPGHFVSMTVKFRHEGFTTFNYHTLSTGPNGERIRTPITLHAVQYGSRWWGGFVGTITSGAYNGHLTWFQILLGGGNPYQSILYRSPGHPRMDHISIVGYNLTDIGDVPDLQPTPLNPFPPRPRPPRPSFPNDLFWHFTPDVHPPDVHPEPQPQPDRRNPPNSVPFRRPNPFPPNRNNPDNPINPRRVGVPIPIGIPQRPTTQLPTITTPTVGTLPPVTPLRPPLPSAPTRPLLPPVPERPIPNVINPPSAINPPDPPESMNTPAPPPGGIVPFRPGALQPIRPGELAPTTNSPIPPCESDPCLSGIARMLSGMNGNVTNINNNAINSLALNQFLESNDISELRQKLGFDYPQSIEQQIDNQIKQQKKALDANLYGVAAALYNSLLLSKTAKNDLGDIYSRLGSVLDTAMNNPMGNPYPSTPVSPAEASGKVRESLATDQAGNIPDEMAKANRLAILGSNLHHASMLNSTATIKGIEKVLEYLGNINNALVRTGKLASKYADIKPDTLSLKTREIDALDGTQDNEPSNPNDGDFYEYLIDDLKLKADTIASIENFVQRLIEQTTDQVTEIEGNIIDDQSLTNIPNIPETAHYPE